MAKYQRNLALYLVRSRKSGPQQPAGTAASLKAPLPDSAPAEASPPPPPLPLSRGELDGLRGGTTREGRQLEDWHPESLAAMWCTSLLVREDDISQREEKTATGRGNAWERGRERTLSVLRWVSTETASNCGGGVTAGTVVPTLVHKFASGAAETTLATGNESLQALSSSLTTYLGNCWAEDGARDSGSTRRSGAIVVDSPVLSASSIPRRLLSLTHAELSALAALLDEALGRDSASSFDLLPSASHKPSSGALDTAASLFSRGTGEETRGSKTSVPAPGGFGNLGQKTAAVAHPTLFGNTSVETAGDECANIFLLARGLRSRLVGGRYNASGGGGDMVAASGEANRVASSAVLGMLLSSSATQAEVLEKVCPHASGLAGGGGFAASGDVAQGLGLTWDVARALMLPLWIRDVKELQRVTSTLAANTYRQDKDLMAVRLCMV